MEVQEICKKLKPIIGNRAERYWLAYLAEDQEGKKEIEIALQLMAVKHLGSGIGDSDTNLSVPPSDVAAGEYPLGQIIYAGKQYHEFGLREDEWIQHVAIFGRSGAGKTNTVFVLIDNLLNKNKPFFTAVRSFFART
jgi:DNA helicase HerA-like ATPase